MPDMLTSVHPVPVRAANTLPCGDRLQPMPPDTDHDGWVCVRPQGHLPEHDHRAEDGTTW